LKSCSYKVLILSNDLPL